MRRSKSLSFVIAAAALLSVTGPVKARAEAAPPAQGAAVKEAPPAADKVPGGLVVSTAGGDAWVKVWGYAQLDGRFFYGDDKGAATDTFTARRIRPGVDGQLCKNLSFRILPDFGEGKAVLQDAYVDVTAAPAFKIRVGKFKTPVGLERLQSSTDIRLVERGFPTSLVPNRDVGVQLFGDLWEGAVGWALAYQNGVPDGASGDLDTNDDKDLAGRLFFQPFKHTTVGPIKGLGLGVAGSFGRQAGSLKAKTPNLPSFKSAGQQSIFAYRTDADFAADKTVIASGKRVRLSPQATYYWGPVGLLFEYVRSSQEIKLDAAKAELTNTAWQVEAAVALTGEDESYKGLKPDRPVSTDKGGFGAFELAGRYGALTFDDGAFKVYADPDKSVKDATGFAVGLNWYPAASVKVAAGYEQTTFTGGAKKGGDREPEKVVQTRLQAAF